MPLYDLLAERRAEDDALCAVCGGGDSDKTAENEIVFCERCDVAVHQKCYAIDVIPAGGLLEIQILTALTHSPISSISADLLHGKHSYGFDHNILHCLGLCKKIFDPCNKNLSPPLLSLMV